MIINGLNIRELRKRKKLTQEELAQKIGVTRQTVIGYERGEVIPEAKQSLLSSLLLSEENATDLPSAPYYPEVNASAGLDFLTGQSSHYRVPISIPGVKADAFINVFGDSMYPKYSSGQIIGIKETEKDMVMFGHAYVVQMSDGEGYLKYVRKGHDDDHWLLDNENPNYQSREFHLSKIQRIFIIKAVIWQESLL